MAGTVQTAVVWAVTPCILVRDARNATPLTTFSRRCSKTAHTTRRDDAVEVQRHALTSVLDAGEGSA